MHADPDAQIAKGVRKFGEACFYLAARAIHWFDI